MIEYDRPMPDPESRDYIQISEVPHDPELFNDATGQTFTVSISGQTLVFAADHPANLHRQYNERLNVREMRLYADKVIIRSPLLLPQTALTIHARELRFEGDGRIETTPAGSHRRPDGAMWEDNLLVGRDGDQGHPGGNVDMFVERFYADDGAMPRFMLRGGDGGPAGEGRDGRAELSGRISIGGLEQTLVTGRESLLRNNGERSCHLIFGRIYREPGSRIPLRRDR